LVDEAERTVSEVFDAHAVIYLPDENRRIRPILDHPAMFAASAAEFAAAQWVLDHNEPAGAGTNTLPNAQALYLPMATPNGVLGVLALEVERQSSPTGRHLNLRELPPDVRQLLETYATQIAFAIERDRLTEMTQQAELRAETEKLRSSLLAAVSHDLRTPLAGIAGASSSLAQSFESLDPLTRRELLDTICDESERLCRLVENLLHMTRLSSGRLSVDRQWQPVDDVIGSALNRMERYLTGREVDVQLGDGLPLGHFDAVLVELVLMNLLDNSVKYSDPGSPILVQAQPIPQGISLAVSDRGRGLRPGDEQQIFDMFYRGADVGADRWGTGLGLAICRAIVVAHGGEITAANRPGGGTSVRFTLPQQGVPPVVPVQASERAAS
jgi:two-component system sensor histidine kinase KdpD